MKCQTDALFASLMQCVVSSFLLLFLLHIFALTTGFLGRRLHILLSLPGADHGWNGRGGQAGKNAGTKDRGQLRSVCCLSLAGLWQFFTLRQKWTFFLCFEGLLWGSAADYNWACDFVEVHVSMEWTNSPTLTWPCLLRSEKIQPWSCDVLRGIF